MFFSTFLPGAYNSGETRAKKMNTLHSCYRICLRKYGAMLGSDRQMQPARILPPGREAIQPALPGAGLLSWPLERAARGLRHGHHGWS